MECPDIKLVETIIDRLGPGGIIYDLAVFDLDTPDPEYSVDNVSAIAVNAFDFGRRFNNSETSSVSSCPLVFDTGASTGLSPFKYYFLDYYKKCHIGVKGIAGDGGSIVGGGTILRNFTTNCSTNIYLPAHGYHIPKSDILLESPQFVIRSMGGSGHAVIDVWNVEWHLPDKRIIDILIDPGTNLPLIHDFVCTSSEKEKYGPHHVANDSLFREQDIVSKPDHMDQYELNTSVLCCTSVADETNQNLSGAQKELLHWHQNLCLDIQYLQQLMKP